ncbi:MAG TPA: hypothetical protein VKH63_13920, partial [Candidatus Acidoferrum sp.]|nr:hypothetical protein [Candidatus Acidoferrum sp.]
VSGTQNNGGTCLGNDLTAALGFTRDPFMASLPKEALEELSRSYDEVLAKYSTPVMDVAQDGPHNQKESNTAIEDAELDCGSIGH